jgi:membrane protein
MKLTLNDWGQIVKGTFREWYSDNAMRLGAALAYYSMFSVAPLLIIAIAVAGAVYGEEAAAGKIQLQLQSLVGREAAAAIEKILESAGTHENGRLATLLSIGALWLGASWVVLALKDSLDTVWGVMPDPNRSWWSTVKDYLVALLVVLLVGILLLSSLILTAVLTAIGAFAQHLIPIPLPVAYWINLVVSFVVITLLFALLFKLLPDVEINWNDVCIGAAITAVLFLIGRELISIYLAKASVGTTYGAAGSLAVILIWTYYSSLILLLGAEFTQVYARTTGCEIRPRPGGVWLTPALQAEQLTHKPKPQAKAPGEKQPC